MDRFYGYLMSIQLPNAPKVDPLIDGYTFYMDRDWPFHIGTYDPRIPEVTRVWMQDYLGPVLTLDDFDRLSLSSEAMTITIERID